MNRRQFLASTAVAAASSMLIGATGAPRRILLRSSWQTVNIGDIAHTPGMLALLEKHCPTVAVTLWPNSLNAAVERLLTDRFPKLAIARSKEEQDLALKAC